MDEPIRREVRIAAAPKDVWDALTDPAELSAWFGADAQIDLRPGGAVHFTSCDGTERRGLVVELDAPRRLVWRWRELRSTGHGLTSSDATVVEFVVEAHGDGARVTVTESPGLLAADPPALAESRR
jgi:uncharacterized protein YndB with AHSA1/START domain